MPRIKTTRTVSIALILLRVYLVIMLLIILAKFVIEARGRGKHEESRPAATGTPQTGTDANAEIPNPKHQISNKSE